MTQRQKEGFMSSTTQERLPKLLDLQEAASLCHVSTHTVRSWVRKKRLAPVRICRRLLFHPAELERFIDEGQSTESPKQ
jgi:excisionase family DNA binding protein